MFVGVAGAGENCGLRVLFAQRDNLRQYFRAGKIDYYVEVVRDFRNVAISAYRWVRNTVEAARNDEIVAVFGLVAHEPTHFSVNSEYKYAYHNNLGKFIFVLNYRYKTRNIGAIA